MLICDSHCDTLYKLYTKDTKDLDITPEKLKQGGVNLQTCAMYVGTSPKKEDINSAVHGMLEIVEILKQKGLEFADGPSFAREGETKYMLSVEGCEPMEDDLSSIEKFRSLGVRMAALTWNYDNKLASCHKGEQDRGLTQLGREALKEFNRLNIAADLSHINEKGFWDALENSEKPPMASHSCAKALCKKSRNLSDEQLRALFSAGGFVGVNFYPAFLSDTGKAGFSDILRHIMHMYEMGGSGKVGFGSDFDGIETKAQGLKDARDYPALLDYLKKSGELSQKDVEDIAGKAFISYFERI
jgi:membrane dipeptidase